MISGFVRSIPEGARKATFGLVTAAMVSVAAFIGFSVDKGAPMTAEFEGTVLANYIDGVGVETWCIGETQIGHLAKGYTKDYCMNLFLQRYPQYSRAAYNCYDAKAKRYVTPAMHAAITDVFYNIGVRCKSSMIRNLKAGKPVEACKSLLAYRNAGGKDCSVKANGCYGVWDRRLKVVPMCMNDAQRIPAEGLGL